MKMNIYKYKWLIIGVIFLIGSELLVKNYCNIDARSLAVGVQIGLCTMYLCALSLQDWL